MKKIIGYSHNWLVNHWEEIVTEQLHKLVESGLYDATDMIYCGIIGDNDSFKRYMEIIAPYSKIKVQEYSTTAELYEFHTLDIIKTQADQSEENYYIYYIHTKGVTYGIDHENNVAYKGGTEWRRFMEKWTITKWRDNVAELDKGYEICGTQMRVRDWARHYSGSFWWAKSEYIRILRPIPMLDISDRMQAEFWIGSGEPIAATLSQQYYDYYTQDGEFTPHYSDHVTAPKPKPPQPNQYIVRGTGNESVQAAFGRNIVHTLCWNLPSEVEIVTKRLYELNERDTFTHVICDLDFPLVDGNKIPNNFDQAKQANTEALKNIAKKYGSQYIKFKNEGVSQNWTQVARHMNITDADVLICSDPDERIHHKSVNWVSAIGKVIRKDRSIAVVSLIMPDQISKQSFNETNSIERTIDGIEVYEVRGGAMWSTCGISGKFINELGGIPYPVDWSIYGHLESACSVNMDRLGYKWVMLKEYVSTHTDNVMLLRKWKDAIIHGNFKEKKQIHFQEWMELKKHGKA